MNLIKTDSSFSPGYSSPEFYYQRPIKSTDHLDTDIKLLKGSFSSEVNISAESKSRKFRVPTIFNHNLNNAIGLVQSIVAAAIVIEKKLGDIKTLAKENHGATSQAIKKVEESIIGIANGFKWNGIHYMAGEGEQNRKTQPRKLIISTGPEPTSELQIKFKSFNPTSAVKTEKGLDLVTLNPMNIDNSYETGTHAYGSAVLHSSLSNSSLLHTHTMEKRDQTIIQISTAIDGVKQERTRLEGYLTQLNDIPKTDPNELFKKSNYISQTIDFEKAYEITIFVENELPKNLNRNVFPKENISDSILNELLH
jgi:hypothetical protein